MVESNKKKIVAHSNPKPVHLSDFLSFDNIWKLAIVAFMVASLYLQNNFITKAEFREAESQIRKMELVLGQLEIKNQIDATQNKTLDLIEIRLRQIEQSVAILGVNKKNNEKEY